MGGSDYLWCGQWQDYSDVFTKGRWILLQQYKEKMGLIDLQVEEF